MKYYKALVELVKEFLTKRLKKYLIFALKMSSIKKGGREKANIAALKDILKTRKQENSRITIFNFS